jgi:hypothetical protein
MGIGIMIMIFPPFFTFLICERCWRGISPPPRTENLHQKNKPPLF